MVASKDQPNWRPNEWEALWVPIWQKIQDCWDKLPTQESRSEYLFQGAGEHDERYTARVCLASLDNDFKRTIRANAGLLQEFNFTDEVDPELTESKNVDNQGSTFSRFLGRVSAMALRDEFCLLGCHLPMIEEGSTGRQPYFSLITASQIYAPFVITENGSRRLSQVSIKTFEETPDGRFGSKLLATYHVYMESEEGVIAEKWQADTEDDDSAITQVSETRVLTNARNEPLTRLPFVWLGIDPDSQIGVPQEPPFLVVCEKLLQVLNQESELDSIQNKVNLPVPHEELPGDVPEVVPDKSFGDSVWYHAKDTTVGFAEPTGSSIAISHQRIQDRKAEIKAEEERFLGVNAPETLGQSLLDAGQTRMTLETIAESIESAVGELLKIRAALSDRTFNPETDDAGTVRINMTALKPPPSDRDVLAVAELTSAGVLVDRFEARAKLKQMGYLTDEVIDDAETARENAGATARDAAEAAIQEAVNFNNAQEVIA